MLVSVCVFLVNEQEACFRATLAEERLNALKRAQVYIAELMNTYVNSASLCIDSAS
jgi:hypothetical protein